MNVDIAEEYITGANGISIVRSSEGELYRSISACCKSEIHWYETHPNKWMCSECHTKLEWAAGIRFSATWDSDADQIQYLAAAWLQIPYDSVEVTIS